jgi:hypothetical protein
LTRSAVREIPGGSPIFQRIFTRLGLQGRPPRFIVEYRPFSGLTQTIRLRDDVAHVKLSDGLRGASLRVHEAVATILLARLYRRRAPHESLVEYRQFVVAPGTRRWLTAARKRRAPSRPAEARGNWHNLQLLFSGLNRGYFEGSLDEARLGWSSRSWRRQLGCFDPALRHILINRLLDREDVPAYVVEYVLYHEMLHMKHPLRLARCRIESHSARFRAEEKRFAHYSRAIRFLRRFPFQPGL